jgi:glycogen debranching enzyme
VTKPKAAVDIRDVQVIKHDRAFFIGDEFGDVPSDNTAALGLYYRDTRYLSQLEFTLNELRPLMLHSSTERNYSQIIELAYPIGTITPDGVEEKDNISLSRSRVLAGSLLERIRVSNYGRTPHDVRLCIDFGADFLDLFEVRGWARERRGQMQAPLVERSRVVLSYRGLDGVVRSTTLRFSPQPTELTGERATFELELAPGEAAEVGLEITPAEGDEDPQRTSFREAKEMLEHEYSQWRRRCTRFKSSHLQLSQYLDRAILDLRMLQSTDDDGDRFIDAGVPWYSTLFGRDSLITAYQVLGVNSELAWGTLRGLAELQGTEVDEWRDEEPGKILHEVRVGELAKCGEIPHTPYYGSIDSTPLWLAVLASAYFWTNDVESVKALWPNALACLEWIDRYGDIDGDGYVEYARKSAKGLANQGWKDSHDSVVFPDGAFAEAPIALVEVQGYVYLAKIRMARLARDLGDAKLADRLDAEAKDLKERFNKDFWMEKEGYFALALDGKKQQVPVISSNPGHCLWSEIVDEDKAPRVARKLLGRGLSSGWGIRTLSAREGPFDPIGYHTGTVWPHDNSLIAHGLKRYGLDREAMQVVDQLSAAGMFFPLSRYPELFCGFSSEDVPVPVQYPVACSPQAWASGAPFLMLRTYGGITADAPKGVLNLIRPRLPSWLQHIDLQGMRVGDTRIDLSFSQTEGITATQVPRKDGDLDVVIRQ